MAYSAGSIAFSGLPATSTVITLNDGQSGAFSEVKFGISTSHATSGNYFQSGTVVNGLYAAGNASDHITMHLDGSTTTTNRGYSVYSFARDSQLQSDFQDMATGGSTPLVYEFGDAAGNTVNITLVNESSGFVSNVAGSDGTKSRKDSAGNYSINTYTSFSAAWVSRSLAAILTAAFGASEIDLDQATRDGEYLTVRAPNHSDGPLTFRVKRASGSWAATAKAAAHVLKAKATQTTVRIANIYAPDEVTYSIREPYTDVSGTLTAAQFATYLKETINNLPIGITATVSGGTVSLTNDVSGGDGDVTITTTDSTNITLSGMSGGATSEGGSDMKTGINNNQLRKLEKYNKVDAKAINITGSAAATGSLAATAVFTVQQPGIEAQKMTAATMQNYFSKTDIVEATDNLAYKLIFTSGSGGSQDLKVDDDTLTWNASSELLTVAGTVAAATFTASGNATIEGIVSGAAGTFDALAGTSLALQSGGITAAGSVAGATSIDGSGDLTMGTITMPGFSVDADGDVSVKTLDVNSGGITDAGAIAGATTIAASSNVTIEGIVSGAAGTFDALGGTSLALQSGGITAAGAIAGATTIAMGGALTGATTIAASSNATIEGIVSGAAGTFDALAGTSLALQSGGITAAGAIAGATTVTLSGELDAGSLDVSGIAVIDGTVTLGTSGGSADTTVRGDLAVGENLTVTGNLTVQGSTVTVDATSISISSSFTFEGPADDHETTFHAGTPTTDLTVYLPQFSASAGTQSFYLPALIDAPTDASSKVTAAEFALLDGASTVSTPTVADGDGVLFNDAGTMKQVTVQSLAAYFDDEITNMPNLASAAALTTVGTVGTGVWQGTAVASAYLDADTAHLTTAQTFSGAKTFSSLASLDGGVDVNGALTISAAGAIAGATTIAASSNATIEGIVSGAAGTFDALAGTSLALQSGGITAAGSVAGATTVSGSGLFSAGGGIASGLSSQFTVSNAGAVVGQASDFASLALNSGGITAAGAIAGATTIAASSNATIEGIVSGAAGTFDALAGTSLALQSGGITAAGAIAGATTVSGSGNLDMGGEVQLDGVAEVVAAPLSDSFYFLDSDGLMKRDVMIDVLKLGMDQLLVEHTYMSSSSEHSGLATGSIQTGATFSSFTLGGNNYSSGMVTASFDVYLNGLLQTRSGSTPNSSTAWDYILTSSGERVLFEPQSTTSGGNYVIDDDDVVIIKYLVK